MTTRAARTTWKGHELVTKAIFEALLKQSNAQNLEIKHNAKIPGLKVGHQIDVYWKFSMGGIDHFVIVEVKRKKAKAKSGRFTEIFRRVERYSRTAQGGVCKPKRLPKGCRQCSTGARYRGI